MPSSLHPPERATLELAVFNRRRLTPGLGDSPGFEPAEAELQSLEIAFVENERAFVRDVAAAAPSDADGFVRWFEALRTVGPGQGDPLFPFLEHKASLPEMKWFLGQEISGEAGFEDLVALTQVKMPARAKLELARNYWDEMGQGHASGMHGPMLSRLASELGLGGEAAAPRAPGADETVWQSLALGNAMIALATHRRYAFHSLGALGVIELTAPGRAVQVNAGLRRLGVGGEARRYFALHATLDIKHSESWNREILRPLVDEDPRRARPIAEGALIRLTSGARCFERYRREFGLTP